MRKTTIFTLITFIVSICICFSTVNAQNDKKQNTNNEKKTVTAPIVKPNNELLKTCKDRIQAISMAIELWANDHNGKLPTKEEFISDEFFKYVEKTGIGIGQKNMFCCDEENTYQYFPLGNNYMIKCPNPWLHNASAYYFNKNEGTVTAKGTPVEDNKIKEVREANKKTIFNTTGIKKNAEERKKAEQIAKEKAKKEQIAKEKAEKERIAKEKAEKDKVAKEKAEKDKVAKEKAEKDKVAKEKAEKDKVAKEKAEKDKVAKEKAEKDKVAKEKAEKDKVAKEKAEKDKIAKEKAEKDKIAKEKAEKDKIAKEKAEKPMTLKEKAQKEQALRDKVVKGQWVNPTAKKDTNKVQKTPEQIAKEKAQKEQALRDKALKEKTAKEQEARDKALKEKAEKERIAKEKAQKERKKNPNELTPTEKEAIISVIKEFYDAYASKDLDKVMEMQKNSVEESAIEYEKQGKGKAQDVRDAYRAATKEIMEHKQFKMLPINLSDITFRKKGKLCRVTSVVPIIATERLEIVEDGKYFFVRLRIGEFVFESEDENTWKIKTMYLY